MWGWACHHCPWLVHTVLVRQVWHDIIALDNTHGRTTLGMACLRHHWTENMAERYLVLNAIIDYG